MAAAGRRWQRCSSCGCRLMSASGQRPCCPSHGRGHHLPGRSTSIRALWRTAWLHESACWAVAVERWARREATRRRKGLFHPFVRYLTHLDLASAASSSQFKQFVRHAEQTAGGCPTSPGVDLGMPSLEGVRAMLLVQRFKSGFFDFYRLAAPLRAPAGRRATPCSLFFSTCLLPTSPLRFPC